MSNKTLAVLVFISLGLGGYATWKHLYKDAEEIAKLTVEGMQKIQAREAQEEKANQLSSIRERAAELNSDKESPFAGNIDGDLTIVYFFDYRCGYCRKADPVLDELLNSDSKLKVIYKEYPIFQDSMISSAALAAHKQGRYMEMHRALMAHHGAFSKEVVLGIAKDLKLDIELLEKDMKDVSVKEMIEKNHKMAESLGIHGTPMFIIGGSMILPGSVSVDEFRSAIEKVRGELAAGGTSMQEEPPHDQQTKKES